MELEVSLAETPVGVLRRSSDRGDATRFRFYDSYRRLAARPVLGQVYEDYLAEEWGATQRLPPFFSNLLPEGPMREHVAQQIGVHPDRELYLLVHLGRDLPGAVIVRPLTPLDAAEPVTSRPSTEEHARLRFSLAGVQLKFSMLREGDRLTLPMDGMGGRWIVKLPDRSYPQVPETEFATMAWARASGIEVPECTLVRTDQLEGIPAEFLRGVETLCYAIRRFDRLDSGQRVHMEDFAQVFGIYADRKYDAKNFESIGNIVYQLGGLPELRVYVRRLVFMVLSGNGDAHHKNWSLLYQDGIHPRLSPAYDLLSTVPYLGDGERLALKFGGSKEFSAVGLATFERMARKLGVDPSLVAAWVTEDVQRCMDAWSHSDEWPLPGPIRAGLTAHLDRLRRTPGSLARL
jgi:serine/threonine-protein kinase HipA